MITVMGASGHTGGKIAETLLAAGERVRALGRSAGKLAALQRAGAEVLAGDATDPTFLTHAFRDADAVYTLVSPDPTAPDYRAAQDRIGEAIATAVRASGVRHVVALSSLGADIDGASGAIVGLRAQEERLASLGHSHVLLLRPASFFENFASAPGMIKEHGFFADAVAAEVEIPMVTTRDIADAAAKALRARDWTGVVVRELLGPCDLSYAAATRLLGERIGRPDLKYVQFADHEMVGAHVNAGLSPSFASLYVGMTRAINARALPPRAGRRPENTTSTRFEAYAAELAEVFRAL